MYSIDDPNALQGLSRCIGAFSRISEVLSIDATPEKLELSCVNHSRTVMARAVFPRDACFSGPGARRAVQVKSRAAEVVFSRIHNSTCVLNFGRVHNDVEVVEVLCESPSAGMTRAARLPCLIIHEPAPETESDDNLPYYFSMGLDFIKEVLANCMPAAEEAELRFLSHKGFTFRAFRDKSRVDQSKVRAGVDTSIENEFRRFDALEVLSPWASTMRLKELRTLVQLHDQLFPASPLSAAFKRPGDPLKFEAQHPESHIAVMFHFTTKAHRSALDNTSSVMIRIGEARRPRIPRPVSYGRPESFMQRAGPPRIQRIASAGPIYDREALQPATAGPGIGDSTNPTAETPGMPPHESLGTSAVSSSVVSAGYEDPPQSPIFVGYAEDDEVGMTQAASQAVGLFDPPPRKMRRQE